MLQRRALLLATTIAVAGTPLLLASRASLAAEVKPRVVGDPNAPVTMIEYASLTCPHCAAFHTEVLPEFKKRYIDTGKVKLEMRDFPLDQVALKAAVVAHCAGEQRYFPLLQVLFETQSRWAYASDPVAALKQIAKLGGLGEDAIDACLADPAMENAVLEMRLQGQDHYEIRSTPTFVINGKTYAGNRSLEEFAAIVDPLLPS